MSLVYNSSFWAFCLWWGLNSSYYQINKVLRIYATLYHVEIFPGKNIPTDGKVMMKIKVASVYGTRCRLGFSLTDTVRFFCTPRFLVTITTTTTMTNKVARLLELFILTNAVIFRPNVSRYSRFQVDLLNTIIIETAYRSSSTGVHLWRICSLNFILFIPLSPVVHFLFLVLVTHIVNILSRLKM